MTLVLIVTIGVLYGIGTWLLQQRTLTRLILGIIVLGHGANLLLLLSGGHPGLPPIVGEFDDPATASDPLPQALALTAIVISFGVTAFLLALAYRSWQLTRNDEVEDDLEDRRIALGRGDGIDDDFTDASATVPGAGDPRQEGP
ncbi:MAG: Na(+)/H(+) antiporter subunit C [Acidimicrobiia bacterium]|nr:Na(+)/H(+) antiporter subunit C [Acidimicrobiia bacterium]